MFGNTTDDDLSTVVSYTYGVERNKAVEESTGKTLPDSIMDLEGSMLNLLVESFYSGCSSSPESRKLFDSRHKHRGIEVHHNIFEGRSEKNLEAPTNDNIESHLLGLGSAPVDLANGRK